MGYGELVGEGIELKPPRVPRLLPSAHTVGSLSALYSTSSLLPAPTPPPDNKTYILLCGLCVCLRGVSQPGCFVNLIFIWEPQIQVSWDKNLTQKKQTMTKWVIWIPKTEETTPKSFKYLFSVSFLPSRILETEDQTDPDPVQWSLSYSGRNRLFKETCNIIASYKNTTQENRQGVDIMNNREGLF